MHLARRVRRTGRGVFLTGGSVGTGHHTCRGLDETEVTCQDTAGTRPDTLGTERCPTAGAPLSAGAFTQANRVDGLSFVPKEAPRLPRRHPLGGGNEGHAQAPRCLRSMRPARRVGAPRPAGGAQSPCCHAVSRFRASTQSQDCGGDLAWSGGWWIASWPERRLVHERCRLGRRRWRPGDIGGNPRRQRQALSETASRGGRHSGCANAFGSGRRGAGHRRLDVDRDADMVCPAPGGGGVREARTHCL